MAWEKPKTDWQTGDAPTADAFNRIEKNILDLKDNKRDKSSTVPVANGGTGATNAVAARNNLGIEYISWTVSYAVRLGTKKYNQPNYEGTPQYVSLDGIKIGPLGIYSGFIEADFTEDEGWMRIFKGNKEIIAVSATPKKLETYGYAPSCIVHSEGNYIYIADDYGGALGFNVIIVAKD